MKRKKGLIIILLIFGIVGLGLAIISFIAPSLLAFLGEIPNKHSIFEIAGIIVAIIGFLGALSEFSGYNLRSLIEIMQNKGTDHSKELGEKRREIVTKKQQKIILSGKHSKFEGDVLLADTIYQISNASEKDDQRLIEDVQENLLNEEWFFGRREELSKFEAVLDNESGFKCFYIHGFAGVGKSAFLRELLRKANAKEFQIIGGGVSTIGPYETFADFASRVGRMGSATKNFSSVYEILIKFSRSFVKNTILAIDEFRGSDERLVNDFNWFLEAVSSRRCKTIIIVASREKSIIKSTLPVQYFHLKPFSIEETKALINYWGKDIPLEKFLNPIYRSSSGYPQLVEYICNNTEILQEILTSKIIEFNVLDEIWASTKNSAYFEILKIFSVLSQYTKEHTDDLADALIKDWQEGKEELLNRSLIDTVAPNVYKMHDLLGDYIYKKMGRSDRRQIHKQIGTFFLYDVFFQPLLAFYHLVKAEDFDQVKHAHAYIRQKLKFEPYNSLNEAFMKELIENIGNRDLLFRSRLLEDLGFMYLLKDSYDVAENLFDEACELYKTNPDIAGMAWCNYGLGTIHRMRANFSLALKSLDDSEIIFRNIEDQKGVAYALRDKSEVLRSIGCYDQAKDAASESLEISNSIKDGLGCAATLRILADLKAAECKFNDALDIYNKAYEKSVEIGAIMSKGYVLNAISHVLRLMSRYDEAIIYSKQSIEALATISDNAGICFSIFGYAESQRLKKNYEVANKQYKKAREIAKRINHIDFELFASLGIGEIHRAQRRYQQAIELFGYVLKNSKKYNLDLITAHSLLCLGESYRLLGKFEKDYFNQALEIYEEIGSKWGSVHTLIGKALATLAIGMNTVADQYYSSAYEICNECFLKPELLLISQRNSDELHPICFNLT